jgi:hypothetical protein
MKNNKNCPLWLLGGIMALPVAAIEGLLLYLFLGQNSYFLFWLITPAVVFEEFMEKFFYALSNSQIANFLFVFVFWFALGVLSGWLASKLKKK